MYCAYCSDLIKVAFCCCVPAAPVTAAARVTVLLPPLLQGLPYSTYLTNPNSLHINILNAISSDLSEPEASNVYVQAATPIGTTGVRLSIVADGYNDPPDVGAALRRTPPPLRIAAQRPRSGSWLRWMLLECSPAMRPSPLLSRAGAAR